MSGRRYVVHCNLLKPGSAEEQVSRRTAESYKTKAIKDDSEADECTLRDSEEADECTFRDRPHQAHKIPSALPRPNDNALRDSLQNSRRRGRPPDADSETAAAAETSSAKSEVQQRNAGVNEPIYRSTRSKKQISDEQFRSLLNTIEQWQLKSGKP